MHGENDQRDLRELASQILDQFQSRFVFEGNINKRDIGLRLADFGGRLGRIFCVAADHEIALRVYEICESLPNERMVIDYKDAPFTCHHSRKLRTDREKSKIIATRNL